ncbi:hypothetical protein ABZ921_39650 [Streptomyces atriruber]|uniref:Secreted protein n=1 Tax=Streptomyces atriruber TaxID=545121 RepID=A0ABV3C0G9_9ACTN
MRRARGLCGAATGLGLATALVVLTAPQAAAGGPTSVLLVSPESTESASLYCSDKEYAELESWLAPSSSGRKPGEEPPGLDVSRGSRQINVTWMAHDVLPWRVDRVYAPQSGKKKDADVWVHRSTDIESLNGDWHRAAEPGRLLSLFKELGLLGKASDRGSPGIAPQSQVTPELSGSGTGGDENRLLAVEGGGGPGGTGTDWWWAIPGAGVGALAALLLRGPVAGRWAAVSAWRRRPDEPGPRQELRDL